MKKLLFLITACIMSTLLCMTALAAMTPGINLLTGTTEPMTFDDLTSLPSNILNAELTDSPFESESGKVLHATLKNVQYSTVHFRFNPALDRTRPYRISFKAYKKADEGYGNATPQLWIMKNGTSGWQIAKEIGSFAPNNAKGWYIHDYTVTTFGSLIDKNTGAVDTTDINSILLEWAYHDGTTGTVKENVYFDDVSIIPAYKVTYLDEDGSELKVTYESLTGSSFEPMVTVADANNGIIGWSKANDGTVDESIVLNNTDLTLYAVYDNNLNFNLKANKTLLIKSGDVASLTTNLWHRNGVDGITVSYSVAEGSSYVTLKDNGNGSATVTAKGEGMAKIVCTASTGEKEEMYILSSYMTLSSAEKIQTVPTISASEWLYDHTGTTFDTTENAWKVIKRTDVVKSDDGNGNIVYYTNGFLSKQTSVDTSTYKYLLFRVKADKQTSFQVAVRVNSTYKYAYPSTGATNGEYVELCADLSALANQAGSSTINQFVLGVTNNQNNVVYIKDITLSNIPVYEPEIPEKKIVKVLKKVSAIEEDMGTASVQAAMFSNKSSENKIAWKSSSDCIVVKNDGNGNATLKAMGDGTATITAYADGDATVAESFTVTVSGQREKQSVYDIRVFFWGASTTKHSPSPSIGWYHDWGMAASAEENDYVHKLVSYLEKEFYPSKVSFKVIAASTWDNALTNETSTTKDWTTHAQYVEIEALLKDFRPNIIVTAMTGNMGSSTPVDVAYNAYKQMYDMMYSYCPDAIVVAQHCGLSCVTRNDLLIEKLDKNYSDKTFFDYHVNPTMKLDPMNLAPEYAAIHSGVAAHWGDKGHNLVATTCFNYIAPEVPSHIEAEYIYIPEEIEIVGDTKVDEKGASLQLGLEITPNDAASDVIWSVDNSNIATVSDKGVVTPLSNGTVVVTAKSAYDADVYDTHTIVITNQLDNFTLTYAAGTTDTVTGLPAPDDYAAGNYVLSTMIPLRDAYTFVGWGLTENAKEAVTSVNMTKPITVYALWEKTTGFEFDGEYDENNGFIYGFDITSGFHNNVSGGFLKTTCTAGSKVTFNSPVLDVENKGFVVFGLESAYADENGKLEVTVETTAENKTYVYPLTSTDYTVYVIDTASLSGNIKGVSIYVNTVPEDKSMFDVKLDYLRFTPVRQFAKTAAAVTDGKVTVSTFACEGYTAFGKGAALASDSDSKDAVYVMFESGYTAEFDDTDKVYIKAADSAKFGIATLTEGSGKTVQDSYRVYTASESGFAQSEELTDVLKTYDEASIRTNAPDGIRVKASVLKGSNMNNAVDAYGFIITRKDYLDNGRVRELVYDEEYLAAKDVVGGAAFDRVTGYDRLTSSDDINDYFTAVLYNIPRKKSALNQTLVFRPYIRLADGSYVYGVKIERSIFGIATDLYFNSDIDEETKEYIEDIFTICEFDFDSDIFIDGGNLY